MKYYALLFCIVIACIGIVNNIELMRRLYGSADIEQMMQIAAIGGMALFLGIICFAYQV